MTIQETVKELEKAPIAYRIEVMELLLQSLKAEIMLNKPFQPAPNPFQIRTFNLGADILVDRDLLYAERGF